MSIKQNKYYIIICEGKSEYSYIQNINRIFNEEKIPIVLSAKKSDSGTINSIYSKYKEVCKSNRNENISVWMDDDLCIRENSFETLYKKINKEKVFFSNHNFEDFLFSHTNDFLTRWITICTSKEHFSTPMESAEYLPEVRNLLPGYRKGSLHDGIPVDIDALRTLFKNNDDSAIPFMHTFAEWLKSLFTQNGYDI